MAGLPDPPGGTGRAQEDPQYEVIGGGMIDDERRIASPAGVDTPSHPRALVTTVVGEAWRGTRKSFTSPWFWLACALGTALAWGIAAALVAWAESKGWFDTGAAGATYLIMAAVLALVAAVLGAGWGFRHSGGSIPALLLSGALRGVALAAVACGALLLVGLSGGGPITLAGAAVVVIVLEVALFGLVGAGSRRCFAKVAPGVALAALLVAFLCIGNVVVTILLLPATTGTAQVSVPINVERDNSGRTVSYSCVGELRPIQVEHTERVAWLATSNPAFILGGIGADFVSTDNELGWLFSGLQTAADGPSREVPCLGGVSRDGLAPSVPVALTGLAVQGIVAALVIAAGRGLAARRLRASSGSG